MKRINGVVLIFVFVVVFSSFFVSAIGAVHNLSSSIIKDNRVGDVLQGNINISLQTESTDRNLRFVFSKESVSEEETISVKDFLDAYEEELYDCNPEGCGNAFTTSGSSSSSKSVSLTTGQDKEIGFVFNGQNVEIIEDGFSIDVESNAGKSCFSQLSIDVGGEGVIDWENDKSLGSNCGADKVSTCRASGSFDSWFLIGQEPYCEKIKIGKAPSFDVNVHMKSLEGASFSSDLIRASIYDERGALRGTCNLGKPSTSGSEKSCNIDYVSKTNDEQFVCVSLKEGVNNQGYHVKARDSGSFCGFKGDPGQTSQVSADYDISASPREYAAIGSFTYDDQTAIGQTGSPIVSEVNSFLTERYGGNCPSSGCIVPIILSGLTQTVVIDNVDIKFSNSGANQIIRDKIYTLSKTPATLSTKGVDGYNVVGLADQNIALPESAGEYLFQIFLGSEEIYRNALTINEREIPLIQQIHPRTVAAGVPTRFIVFVDSSLDSSTLNFNWAFSGGSIGGTSTGPIKDLTISQTGEYTLTVTARDGTEEVASSEFIVKAVPPFEAVGEMLTETKAKINNIKTQRDALSNTYKTLFNLEVNIDQIENKVNTIETRYLTIKENNQVDSPELITMLSDLHGERIPRNIKISSSSDVVFIYELDDLELDDFVSVFGQQYIEGQEDKYRNEIFKWYVNNIDGSVKHKTYSIYYDDIKTDLVSEFEVSIRPKVDLTGNGYLLIEKDIGDLTFQSSHSPSSGSGVSGVQVDLSQDSTVLFSLNEGANVFSVPMYFSPDFNQLGIFGTPPPTNNGGGLGFWPKFLFGFILVLIVVGVGYYFIKKWYDENYEKSLFKNRNDLYNIMQFIKNSKAKGMSEAQIRENLGKAKWKREQISYALRKSKGKGLKSKSQEGKRRIAKI